MNKKNIIRLKIYSDLIRFIKFIFCFNKNIINPIKNTPKLNISDILKKNEL